MCIVMKYLFYTFKVVSTPHCTFECLPTVKVPLKGVSVRIGYFKYRIVRGVAEEAIRVFLVKSGRVQEEPGMIMHM